MGEAHLDTGSVKLCLQLLVDGKGSRPVILSLDPETQAVVDGERAKLEKYKEKRESIIAAIAKLG